MQYSAGLKKNADFARVYQEGKSAGSRYFVLYVLPNELGINRLGVSVSKKVGNSVIRHRVKRLVKEAYRHEEAAFDRGYDLVVIARPQAAGLTYRETAAALRKVGGRGGVLLLEGQPLPTGDDHRE